MATFYALHDVEPEKEVVMASAAARLLQRRRSRLIPTPIDATGRWAIGHGSAQIASRKRRLRLI